MAKITKGERIGRRLNSMCNTIGASKDERLACKESAGRTLKELADFQKNMTEEALSIIAESENELNLIYLGQEGIIRVIERRKV